MEFVKASLHSDESNVMEILYIKILTETLKARNVNLNNWMVKMIIGHDQGKFIITRKINKMTYNILLCFKTILK